MTEMIWKGQGIVKVNVSSSSPMCSSQDLFFRLSLSFGLELWYPPTMQGHTCQGKRSKDFHSTLGLSKICILIYTWLQITALHFLFQTSLVLTDSSPGQFSNSPAITQTFSIEQPVFFHLLSAKIKLHNCAILWLQEQLNHMQMKVTAHLNTMYKVQEEFKCLHFRSQSVADLQEWK